MLKLSWVLVILIDNAWLLIVDNVFAFGIFETNFINSLVVSEGHHRRTHFHRTSLQNIKCVIETHVIIL